MTKKPTILLYENQYLNERVVKGLEGVETTEVETYLCIAMDRFWRGNSHDGRDSQAMMESLKYVIALS